MTVMTKATSPVSVSGEVVHYPVNNLVLGKKDELHTISREDFWRWQVEIFDAKRAILQRMRDDDLVPVDDLDLDFKIEVTLQVRQRVLSSEATRGQTIRLPVNIHYFTARKYDSYFLDTPIDIV